MALTRSHAVVACGQAIEGGNIGSVFGDIAYPQFPAIPLQKFALRGFSSAAAPGMEASRESRHLRSPAGHPDRAAVAFDDLIARANMTVDAPTQVARQICASSQAVVIRIYARRRERIYVLVQRIFPQIIDWALSRQAPSHKSSGRKDGSTR